MAGPERFEPADDPTRLAHRLDSLADIGRQHGSDPGTTPTQASKPGGARLPARAGTDPLAGPGGERRPAGEPESGSPAQGAASSRPTGPDLSSAGRADTPVPAAAVPAAAVSAPDVSAASVSAAAVPASMAPTIAVPVGPEPPSGDAADLRSDGPHGPAENGPGRSAVRVARTDGATAGRVGTAVPEDDPDTAPAVSPDDVVSVVPGIARYHKADCILIRFLSEEDLELTSRREAEAAGSAPCRACRPDRPSAAG